MAESVPLARMTPAATVALSVVVCTHNPRQDYLSRTLEALRRQTLSSNQWELLIIDNGSTPRVEPDLNWHPHGRVLREETIGLTYARICGIQQTSTSLLVFVDDDNVLAPDYLASALEIGRDWAILGAWGGQWFHEFERTPDEATRKSWTREFAHDRWSNLPSDTAATPWGAGMCVRRSVAEAYVARLESDPARHALGRKGSQLFSAEDIDLALTSCDLGLGTGTFIALKLIHLVPARRLEEGYLLEGVEAMTHSGLLFKYFRGERPCRPSRSQRLLHWYESLHLPKRKRRFEAAKQRGAEAAYREIERLQGERLA
jgi:glycosyltransferase involved in cell wall biosynthesis